MLSAGGLIGFATDEVLASYSYLLYRELCDLGNHWCKTGRETYHPKGDNSIVFVWEPGRPALQVFIQRDPFAVLLGLVVPDELFGGCRPTQDLGGRWAKLRVAFDPVGRTWHAPAAAQWEGGSVSDAVVHIAYRIWILNKGSAAPLRDLL